MRKWVIGLPLATERTQEPLPVRNPVFSQSSELPLFTKGLRFLPKLRNNYDIQKQLRIFITITFCTRASETMDMPIVTITDFSHKRVRYVTIAWNNVTNTNLHDFRSRTMVPSPFTSPYISSSLSLIVDFLCQDVLCVIEWWLTGLLWCFVVAILSIFWQSAKQLDKKCETPIVFLLFLQLLDYYFLTLQQYFAV